MGCSSSGTSDQRFGRILAVYSFGLMLGGLYVGMVGPVRTVVQVQFKLDDSAGVWMISIYTLFYAALIPVIGAIADRYGRNRVFSVCVLVFMTGAAICGLSSAMGGFGLLLVGRAIQAAGAGGMIPVANAEIGTSFPPEKRGIALGVAAGVGGIANVLGAGLGSAVVGAVGKENWPVLFFAAIPFCIALFIGTRILLRSNNKSTPRKLDWPGSVTLALMVLLLLSGLQNLDSWKPFAGAAVCFLAFMLAERHVENPMFHAELLRNRSITITVIASFLIGCITVATMLVPEYTEFLMRNPIGSGGYYMLVMGITSMAGPPLGGGFIDRFGPKRVLIVGLLVMASGYLFLAFYVSNYPAMPRLVLGLAIVGIGMGFMGAPINYMILENTDSEESTSAIATVSLVRQIGKTIALSIFVGVIEAGNGIAGYRHMLICVASFDLMTIIVMCFYRSPCKS